MNNNKYLIEVPEKLNKKFKNFDKSDATEYLDWFITISPLRMKQLNTSVLKKFPNWKGDFTRKSLEILQDWFISNISFRKKTDEEITEIKSQLKGTLIEKVITIKDETLTTKSISVCFDVALYLANTLKESNPKLNWGFKLTPKNYIHYGQPVLFTKKSKIDLNPRSIIEMKALKVLDETFTDNDTFIKLFDIWTKLLK